jgi:hypothetical protein
MKVQLKKSITVIKREHVAAGNESFSIRRDELINSLDSITSEFDIFDVNELPFCCGIREIGALTNSSYSKTDIQLEVIADLIGHPDADLTTSPISVGINYGLMFTIRTGTPADCAFRDALLEILPFKLIGKGVNTNSNNELETYAIFANTAE